MSTRKPTRIHVGDDKIDRALEGLYQAHEDLVTDPAIARNVLTVTLPSGTIVKTSHGLNRPYQHVALGPVSGAATGGWIEDVTPDANKKTQVWLKASGYGATITTKIAIS